MLGSVFAKSLRDLRRSFVGWSLGLAGYVALIVAVYPTIRDNPDLNKLVESYPEALKAFIAFGGQADFTSAAGYLGSELFAFMIPALFLVASVGNGAGAIAGEEERGTLDLLLSFPRSRTRIALEKLAAMCAEVVGLGVVLWLALWIGARIFGMHVSAAHLGSAVAVLVALAVSAYLVNSLAALVDALEPFRKLSPFYHYVAGDPLRRGLDPWHTLFLVVLGVVAAVAGVLLFARRDVAP